MDNVQDRIHAMMSQETTSYAIHDYFSQVSTFASRRPRPTGNSSSATNSNHPAYVDANCRTLMAKWCNSLCDFCKYDRDVTASAMSCVDRFAATPQGMEIILMDRDQYQLAVMTSLYMMAKIGQSEALDPASVAKLSRGKHTRRDIEKMELKMLVGLKWKVHPPTPWSFARELLELIPTSAIDTATSQRIADLTKYQLEAAVFNYELSLQRPSEVAFGAILNAMESMNANCALRYETMVSQLLTSQVHQLRAVRVSLLKVIAEADATCSQPERAILTQRMNMNNNSMNAKVVSPASPSAASQETPAKEPSRRSFSKSPISVSATLV
ncbi:MAG: hypothetical protein SGILL_001128 [Bacillariaceae sp.]